MMRFNNRIQAQRAADELTYELIRKGVVGKGAWVRLDLHSYLVYIDTPVRAV